MNGTGLICAKCGLTGMQSASFVNGLCVCDWCKPISNDINKTSISGDINIAELLEERDHLERMLRTINKHVLPGEIDSIDAMALIIKERDALRARLAQRHIIGKVYEVSRESINSLASELDEMKAEYSNVCKIATDYEQQCDELKLRCERLRVGHEAITANDQMTFGDLYIERNELKAEVERFRDYDIPCYEFQYREMKKEIERLNETVTAYKNERYPFAPGDLVRKNDALKAEIDRLKGEMLTLIKAWDDYFLPDQSPDKEHLFNLFIDEIQIARSALEGGGKE